jgi:hypothetical protein
MKTKHWASVSLFAITLFVSTGTLQKPVLAEMDLSTCDSAILQAANTIKTGRDARVTNVHFGSVAEEYSSYPAGRPAEVSLAMRGRSVANILASNQFMTILATRIINGCGSVGKVTFGMDNTDWSYSYGLVNNQVIGFTCIDYGSTNRTLRWGERYC